MVRARTLLHPSALPALHRQVYPSLVAIQARTPVIDPESGEETYTWADVPGYEALPARIAPLVTAGISAREEITDKATWAANSWHISLAGYYPAITEEHRVLSPEGRAWNVLGVEHDGNLQTTRIKAEERR